MNDEQIERIETLMRFITYGVWAVFGLLFGIFMAGGFK